MRSLHDYLTEDDNNDMIVAVAQGTASILLLTLIESAAMIGAGVLTLAWAIPSVLWSYLRCL